MEGLINENQGLKEENSRLKKEKRDISDELIEARAELANLQDSIQANAKARKESRGALKGAGIGYLRKAK